ncbi:MAG: prolyl oligopeptidase family serine peptidase [Bacteroidales bacterium]|nr:prolyl oligopeptidase family serine peptidase [Bacteroidales bacterium]
MKRWVVCFLILVVPTVIVNGAGQDTVVITKALALKSGSFYRSTFFSVDPVEQAVITGTWRPPAAGNTEMLADGKSAAWTEITADKKGWFRGDLLRGGWVYVRIDAKKSRTVLLEGMSHQMVFVNGKPRVGNRYQSKETFASWEPRWDFSQLPVRLHKGRNDLLFRCNRGRLKVKILTPEKRVFLNTHDLTVPDMITGQPLDAPAATVVVNAADEVLDNLYITATTEGGEAMTQRVPVIRPMTVRKVPFTLQADVAPRPGRKMVHLVLFSSRKKVKRILDEKNIEIRVVEEGKPYKNTFVSNIDGSVQYYAVTPALPDSLNRKKALVLSVHGASVEAINQASSYEPKSWANIVCPTNRRPYGYDWEDWGRLDALEVLEIAKQTLPVDENRVYLTGHSMGGHGTWILGAQYPDQFGAIGPSAGWISWWSYSVRGKVKEQEPVIKMIQRATLPSHTFALDRNYLQEGIYIIHGAEDDNVPPSESHRMVDTLKKFHHDFVFHEQPGAGHWWDVSDEPGADCVDWPPLFDFFARHARPGKERVRIVDFTTASPGVSSRCNWLEIEQQRKPLQISRARIQFDPGKSRFFGETKNVSQLALDMDFVNHEFPLMVSLDGDTIKIDPAGLKRRLFLVNDGHQWQQTNPLPAMQKNPMRYGTFKDAFRHRVVFVVGTHGSKEENVWAAAKARYDAETFWYQGNGSVDIVTDDTFSAEKYQDRSVILYGNAETNSAWDKVLKDCPVRVREDYLDFAKKRFTGNDLAILFTWPRRDSDVASVAVVGGTGITGMRLTNIRPYMYAGFALPDLVIFSSEVLEDGVKGIKVAGFFGNDWSVKKGIFVVE